MVTSGSAIISAVLSTLISQPGDTLLSIVNKKSSANSLKSANASTSGSSSSDDNNSKLQLANMNLANLRDYIDNSSLMAMLRVNKRTDNTRTSTNTETTPSVSSITSDSLSTVQIMTEALRDLGVRGLYKGTKARLIQVTLIVVVQFLVYDYIKMLCGIPVTGLGGGH